MLKVRCRLLPACRLSLLLSGLLAVAVLLPSSALADGGPSIAAAPVVAYGQQQFGNTATGTALPPCTFYYNSYWSLPVTAGDQITIDWEIQAQYTLLLVFPLGTNDFNVGNTSPSQDQQLDHNGRNELVFSASATGNLPLVFQSRGPGSDPECGAENLTGPYDFTAYVRHVVRLSLSRVSKLKPKATLRIAAHNAEGGVITDPNLLVDVQLKTGRKWLRVGSAPVTNAVASVALNIPRRFLGKTMSLRAIAHGGAYLSTATRSRSVFIRLPPKPKAKGKGKVRKRNSRRSRQ